MTQHKAKACPSCRQPAEAHSARIAAARAAIIAEYPAVLDALTRGGAFGGEFSRAIANRMYSRTDEAAIAEARAKLRIEPHGPRTWLLRMPFVNAALFETDEGLVLIDSGYAPAGPALRDAIGKLSSRPLHTIIHTHMHADHAWGAWALMDLGPGGTPPQVVATAEYVNEVEREIRTAGLIARNNNQAPGDVPKSWDDVIRPTLTFHDRMTLTIGKENFVLTHAPGETQDQLWVAVPSRRVVVSVDYYQNDFLPNAGNGKRRQRFPDEWARALREMAALKPVCVLPGHGPAMVDEADIQDRLISQAAMLESITTQVLEGLNAGKRRDEVIDNVALPSELAGRPDAREHYSTAKDIGRMVVKQYSGWWDDVPSHWAPVPLGVEAAEIAALAGGPARLIERARTLIAGQPALASHLADWAWLAAPGDRSVLQGALEIYGRRIGADTTTQEATVYMEHMVRLKLMLDDGTPESNDRDD